MSDVEEKLSLVNKLVKVVDPSDSIDNTGIVQFMYPNFISKDDIFFDYENNILFTGKYKAGLKEELAHGTKNFIALCSSGLYDVDFTNRDVIIKVLYSKWDKDLPDPDGFGKDLRNMSELDFWDFFKKFWVLGSSKYDKGKSLFNLYKVLGKSKHEILKTYLELREVYSDNAIFTGTLSFIEKSLNPDQVSTQSGIYKSLLDNFSKAYKQSLLPIIGYVYQMKCDSDSEREYRTLWLLMQLGKGNAI